MPRSIQSLLIFLCCGLVACGWLGCSSQKKGPLTIADMLARARTAKSPEGKARELVKVAVQQAATDKAGSASTLAEALSTLPPDGQPLACVPVLVDIATTYCDIGQRSAAQKAVTMAMTLTEQVTDPLGRTQLLAQIGTVQGSRETGLGDVAAAKTTLAQASRMATADVAERFREVSESGATGWDLLDDHVHLSLKGQAEVARLMVGELVDFPPPLHVTPEAVASLPGWRVYAEQLGANEYDVYRVHHTMRTLFSVPFMKRSNPEAFRRFQTACQEAEQAMPPTILEAARQWQTFRPHAVGLRPLTGMVARALLRQNKPAEAEPLYSIAQRQVPDYTSWYLEYVYFALACREKIHGTLTEADRELAAAAISQGEFLLRNGFSESGLTERYVGRLHQLRDEWRESIEPLLAARPRMRGPDLVACDQALFEAYRRTGNLPAARELVERGIRGAGEFATAYRAMAAILKLPVEGD